MLRVLLVRLHRWFGLGTAAFLFVAGFTGALIAWEHELDGWLNPELYYVADAPRAQRSADPERSTASERSAAPEHERILSMLDDLESAEPKLSVVYAPLSFEPGHTLQLAVMARPEASGAEQELPYDEVALHPATGEVVASRLRNRDVMPFIYRLHYSLHLPDTSAGNVGVLLLGLVAIAWLLDCCVALSISFPNPRTWYKSLRYRFDSWPRFNFDLHRSSGVWLFGVLLTFAVTAVSMNLERQVVRPLVGLVSDLGPDPFASARMAVPRAPLPKVSRGDAVASALVAAREAGIDARPGGVFYSSLHGVYGVGFFAPGQSHGDGGLGNPWFYFDADTGSLLRASIPGQGSLGELFLQAQFPLHSGRVLGVTGRILVTLLGLAICALSVTGVVLWIRRTRAARRPATRRTPRICADVDYSAAAERRS